MLTKEILKMELLHISRDVQRKEPDLFTKAKPSPPGLCRSIGAVPQNRIKKTSPHTQDTE